MAKRARGSVRPGQRRRVERRTASPAPAPAASTSVTPKPAGLSDAELERAAQLEADLLAQEKTAEQARKQRTRDRGTREVTGGRSGSLAASAETEYAYVARDVKDILKIAGLLIGVLLILWVLIDVTKVIPIGV